VGGNDDTLKVWDAQTGQELPFLKGHTDYVNSVVFSPDGKRLAGASGRELKVWDAQTGQELLVLKGVGPSVAFSSDDKRLVSASYDGMVRVWDARTGQELLTFKGGHTDIVISVAFSPDGKRLASADRDGTVKLWDAQTGQETLTFKGSGSSVAFSPDGHRLASGSSDGTVKIRDHAAAGEAVTAREPTRRTDVHTGGGSGPNSPPPLCSPPVADYVLSFLSIRRRHSSRLGYPATFWPDDRAERRKTGRRAQDRRFSPCFARCLLDCEQDQRWP
jgi:WD40 repeat protein